MTDINDESGKRKRNPFADQLRPTEQLLWLGVKAQSGRRTQVAGMGVIVAVVGVSVGIGVMSDKTLKDAERIKIAALIVGGAVVIATFLLLLLGLYALIRRNRPPEQAYAITNERLLYRSKKTVSTIALEKLPSVSLFLGDGAKGTFSFGAFFPMWSDVENAIEVKHLMDDAQKQRMQKITK